MKRLVPRLMVVAMFAASASLAEAQAVARGGGGGSSSSSGSSGSSSSGGSSGGGGSTTSSSSGGGSSYTPPSPPSHSASAPPRTPSHGGGSGYTSPSRGGDGSNGSTSGSRGTAAIRHPENGSTTTATPPMYSRPDGTTPNGYAIPRRPGAVRPPVYNPPIFIYDPWYWGGFGYGYGLGYMYDPWYRYGYGYSWPGSYGYYGGGYDFWDGGGNYGTYDSTSPSQNEALNGQLRIKVKPREARVIVDGTFMGTVDDFDGMFQKLALPEGRHQVQLQLDGYETLTFNVMIIAGQTVNYEGHMQKVGEAPRR
jgi:hypothetical protein